MSVNKRVKALEKRIDIERTERLGRRGKLIIGTMKENGLRVAVVVRAADQAYRGKCATMSEARERGLLAWMLEASIIPHLQDHHLVKAVIVIERECGDMWVSRIEDWSDPEKLLTHEDGVIATDHRGFSLRHLPVRHMVHLPGETVLLNGQRRARK